MKKIRLFCFPCAGGSASMYNDWNMYLEDYIILHNIELSGRGKRFNSELYSCMEDVVEDIYSLIKDYIDDGPFAFFGHSMGAIIAYELACKIKKSGNNNLLYIFVAGEEAPDSNNLKEEYLYKLPMKEFEEKIISLGGIPKELAENKEILNLYLPIIKSDYKIAETYKCKIDQEKLDSKIIILYGKDDDIKFDNITRWKNFTNRDIKIYSFQGGHFFLEENLEKITSLINSNLYNV